MKTCSECEYFDRGIMDINGHSDCLNRHSDRFQTYATSSACPAFHIVESQKKIDFRAFFQKRNGRQYHPYMGEEIDNWYFLLNETIADFMDYRVGETNGCNPG